MSRLNKTNAYFNKTNVELKEQMTKSTSLHEHHAGIKRMLSIIMNVALD